MLYRKLKPRKLKPRKLWKKRSRYGTQGVAMHDIGKQMLSLKVMQSGFLISKYFNQCRPKETVEFIW